MNIRIIRIIAALSLLPAAFACKKKEEETKPGLATNPVFTVKPYFKNGDKISLTPQQVQSPKEGVTVRYAWKISKLMAKADTSKFENGRFEYTFDKDTVGNFTISCTAIADGYYSTSASVGITLVKPGFGEGCSISGIEQGEGDVILIDNRPNQPEGPQSYLVTDINGTNWFKHNLAYTSTEKRVGLAYLDCEAVSAVMGRYYSWEEARNACPDGWRLPSDSEFMAIAQKYTQERLSTHSDWSGVAGAFMVYAKFNGNKLWEYWPTVKVDNRSGFCAISAGYCNLLDKSFDGVTSIAAFWTADEDDAGNGIYRYIIVDRDEFFRGRGDKKSFGASVRCVEAI